MQAEAPVAWLRRLWERMTSAYGHSWTSVHGTSPQNPTTGALTIDGDTWSRALAGITAAQLGVGLEACVREAGDFPPSVGRFRAMCLDVPSLGSVQRELREQGKRSAFARLVWEQIDGWAYRQAETRAADRMLREAYETAREHVMAGGALPKEPTALIEEQAAEHKPADPEVAASHIDEINRMLKGEAA